MHLRNISLTSSNLIAKKFYLMVCQDQNITWIIGSFKKTFDATSKSYR